MIKCACLKVTNWFWFGCAVAMTEGAIALGIGRALFFLNDFENYEKHVFDTRNIHRAGISQE